MKYLLFEKIWIEEEESLSIHNASQESLDYLFLVQIKVAK